MFSILALTVLAVSVHAELVPLTPSPGQVFNQGASCSFSWKGDKDWEVTNVQLMTGDNYAMKHLDTIATVDGSKDGRFEFTCPEVTPNSAIYFYQFSTSALPENKTWATRFTIASATGESVPPENPLQPGTGEEIPWGMGALVDPSKARPAPAYLDGGAAPSVRPSASGSASVTDSDSASPTSTGASISPPNRAAVSSGSKSASSTAEPTGSAGADNSAGSVIVDSRVWQAAVALGASAMTFTLFL